MGTSDVHLKQKICKNKDLYNNQKCLNHSGVYIYEDTG